MKIVAFLKNCFKNVWLIKCGCGYSKFLPAHTISHSFPHECSPTQNLIPTPMEECAMDDCAMEVVLYRIVHNW